MGTAKRPFKTDRDGRVIYRVQVLLTEEEYREFIRFQHREEHRTENDAARAKINSRLRGKS